MAAEAEAAREARAKVIAAEGEQKASFALKEAAEVIQESPSALQVCACEIFQFLFCKLTDERESSYENLRSMYPGDFFPSTYRK